MSKLLEMIRTDIDSYFDIGLKDVIAKKIVSPWKLQALSALMIAADNAVKAYFPGCPQTVANDVKYKLFQAMAATVDAKVDEFREKFRRDFSTTEPDKNPE